MNACQNQIRIPLPAGFKTPYEFYGTDGLFDGDVLVLTIPPDNYRADNPLEKETVEGINVGTTVITKRFYTLTATCPDQRGIVHLLLQELQKVGNLETQGITINYSDCDERFIALQDFHRFDSISELTLPPNQNDGFSLRVGSLNVEDIKGSSRSQYGYNYNRGTRLNFTQTHIISNGSLVDYRSIL